MNLIRKKLEIIMVEKAEITCRSIKFCIKIMIKLLNYIEEQKEKNSISRSELLLKLKLFFQINKLIIENSSLEARDSTNKQREFFNM
jgi:hypothetical protein